MKRISPYIVLILSLVLFNCGGTDGNEDEAQKEDKVKTCSTVVDGPGTPQIWFTQVPELGSTQNLKGRVSHVASDSFKVAVYIGVEPWGYYNKPTWDKRSTLISCNGNWVTDVTTGEGDEYAVEFVAFLIPMNYQPPKMDGGWQFPDELYDNALTWVKITRDN